MLRSSAAVMLMFAAFCAMSFLAPGQEAIAQAAGDTGIRSADPSVIVVDDAFIAVEARNGRTLLVRVASTLADLGDARPTRIWSDTEGLGEVWAPEIVYRDDLYEVYFAAGVGSAHRMYRIGSTHPDQGYEEAVEIALPEDKWAIDGLPFSYQGNDYFVWSGWQGDTDVQQDLFIVRLDANDAPAGPRARIGTPDQSWENVAGDTPSINEGPQPIVDPAGQLHIVYSANGSWGANYCLADLRLEADGDPLEPEAWSQSDGCLFGANPSTLDDDATLTKGAKGVGHHSFVLPNGDAELAAADQLAIPFLYHGVPAEEEPSNFWAARKWFIGGYDWAPDVTYSTGDAASTGWSPRFSE